MKLLIKNGRVMDPKTKLDAVTDVLIHDGKVVRIEENISDETVDKTVDAEGMLVVPGLVDIHVHLRTPGFENKEDLTSGTSGALAGGVTTVACMPNTNPVLDNQNVVNELRSKIDNEAFVNVEIIGAITENISGEKLADLSGLLEAGVVGFSDDGKTTMNDAYMSDAFEFAKNHNMAIITHSEDHEISVDYKEEPSPPIAEYKIVKRDIELCEASQGILHVAHVSTEESIQYIREAKAKGIKVTCEAAPHHFTLSKESIDSTSTLAKVNPPIREERHRMAVIEGIKDGTIDAIATDHAPHEMASKETEYSKASFGITGLETSFALAYTELVKRNQLDLVKLIELMTVKPAEIIRSDKGTLEVGKQADIAIIDLEEKYTIDASQFLSKGKNTPFNGREVYGVVKYTIVNGTVKFEEGKINVN